MTLKHRLYLRWVMLPMTRFEMLRCTWIGDDAMARTWDRRAWNTSFAIWPDRPDYRGPRP